MTTFLKEISHFFNETFVACVNRQRHPQIKEFEKTF